MTYPPRAATFFGVLTTVVLWSSAAAPQEFATAEREAFAALSQTVAALERADGRGALIPAVAQVSSAIDRAREALAAAEDARQTTDAAYRAAYRDAQAGAVTCDNGYPCTNGRLDRFEGLADALVRHLQLIAAVSFANAAYVEAVGVAGADEARERGTRIRRLASRLRNVDAAEAMDRWNELVGGVLEESDAASELHAAATEARTAARRVRAEDTGRALEAIAAAEARGPAADAALRAVLTAARGAAEVLRARLTAAEGDVAAVVTEADADAGTGEPAPEAEVTVPRAAASEAAAASPTDALAALDQAFAAEAAGVPRPAARTPPPSGRGRTCDRGCVAGGSVGGPGPGLRSRGGRGVTSGRTNAPPSGRGRTCDRGCVAGGSVGGPGPGLRSRGGRGVTSGRTNASPSGRGRTCDRGCVASGCAGGSGPGLRRRGGRAVASG